MFGTNDFIQSIIAGFTGFVIFMLIQLIRTFVLKKKERNNGNK